MRDAQHQWVTSRIAGRRVSSAALLDEWNFFVIETAVPFKQTQIRAATVLGDLDVQPIAHLVHQRRDLGACIEPPSVDERLELALVIAERDEPRANSHPSAHVAQR